MAEERKQKFDPKVHLINKGGKKFITHPGLQATLADQGKGVLGRKVELIQNGDDHESGRWIVKLGLKVKHFETGEIAEVEALGDSSEENTGAAVYQHAPRMAETRAEVRCLRVVTRSEYTAHEELGDKVE